MFTLVIVVVWIVSSLIVVLRRDALPIPFMAGYTSGLTVVLFGSGCLWLVLVFIYDRVAGTDDTPLTLQLRPITQRLVTPLDRNAKLWAWFLFGGLLLLLILASLIAPRVWHYDWFVSLCCKGILTCTGMVCD